MRTNIKIKLHHAFTSLFNELIFFFTCRYFSQFQVADKDLDLNAVEYMVLCSGGSPDSSSSLEAARAQLGLVLAPALRVILIIMMSGSQLLVCSLPTDTTF